MPFSNSKPFTQYLLYLADTTLILSHRHSEWCGHGPILEQDIAITNISLDLLGQARNYYQYVARRMGEGTTEDQLAYHRGEREFCNLLLTELPKGDWAFTVLRQYLFSEFHQLLLEMHTRHADEQLVAMAYKSLKEVKYHLRWSREWVLRLGDGTPESHQRMLAALDDLLPYTGELFIPAVYEISSAADPSELEAVWKERITKTLEEATLPTEGFSTRAPYMQRGGKTGTHTEHLGFILADMQYLQRTYPGCEW